MQFQRILANGWTRAQPAGGVSFPRANGSGSEIDHILVNRKVEIRESEYVSELAGRRLAGQRDALSDHNAVTASVRFTPQPPGSKRRRRRG